MKVILVFVVLVFMCSGVFAVSGVDPASYEIDFEPGYSREFVFVFIIEGDDSVDLYVEGDLTGYVSLDKDRVSGREEVSVSLNLPDKIDKPGVNYVRVGGSDGMDVGGVIKVNVPYPDKYVEVSLNAPNVNVGENVDFDLEMIGVGKDSVVVSPRIEIYKNEENISVLNFDDVEVVSGEEIVVSYSLDSSNYSAGDYLAVAFADSENETFRVENSFRLGEFSVGLVDYTKYFRADEIERFEILVESLWDDDMSDVYVEVRVLNFDEATFVTSSDKLFAWEEKSFVGFLDMSKIEGNAFQSEIILHYDGESVSEIVKLNVMEGIDWVFCFGFFVFVLLALLFVWRCCVFLRRCGKNRG